MRIFDIRIPESSLSLHNIFPTKKMRTTEKIPLRSPLLCTSQPCPQHSGGSGEEMPADIKKAYVQMA